MNVDRHGGAPLRHREIERRSGQCECAGGRFIDSAIRSPQRSKVRSRSAATKVRVVTTATPRRMRLYLSIVAPARVAGPKHERRTPLPTSTANLASPTLRAYAHTGCSPPYITRESEALVFPKRVARYAWTMRTAIVLTAVTLGCGARSDLGDTTKRGDASIVDASEPDGAGDDGSLDEAADAYDGSSDAAIDVPDVILPGDAGPPVVSISVGVFGNVSYEQMAI